MEIALKDGNATLLCARCGEAPDQNGHEGPWGGGQ
jgi:hypothetical protein